MSHHFRLATLVTALVAAVLLVGVSGAGAATRSKNCSPPKYPGSGYFTSMRIAGGSCGRAKKVVLAHYKCRTRHGRKGKCGRIGGYRCSEKRRRASTEFDAVVTCRKHRVKVVYSYQQNT